MPDTVNGLSCLPVQPVIVVGKIQPPAPPAPKAPLSDEGRVEHALGGRFLGREYRLYLDETAGQISFAQYMRDETQRRRNGFTASLVIGVLSIGSALGCYFSWMHVMLNDSEFGDDDDEIEEKKLKYGFSALGCAAVGGLLLGFGIHGLSRSRRDLVKLDALLFEERNGRPIARRWGWSPFVTPNGAGVMAAVEL